MSQIEDLLDIARRRLESPQAAPYTGALTPREAHTLLQMVPEARLVDVRTRAEWVWVGRIPGAVEIEWQNWPEARQNPEFLDRLRQTVPADALILFLCRSGARSHQAATCAATNGWSRCYNILEGFEGEKDASGQRGKTGGWRFAGLPWTN